MLGRWIRSQNPWRRASHLLRLGCNSCLWVGQMPPSQSSGAKWASCIKIPGAWLSHLNLCCPEVCIHAGDSNQGQGAEKSHSMLEILTFSCRIGQLGRLGMRLARKKLVCKPWLEMWELLEANLEFSWHLAVYSGFLWQEREMYSTHRSVCHWVLVPGPPRIWDPLTSILERDSWHLDLSVCLLSQFLPSVLSLISWGCVPPYLGICSLVHQNASAFFPFSWGLNSFISHATTCILLLFIVHMYWSITLHSINMDSWGYRDISAGIHCKSGESEIDSQYLHKNLGVVMHICSLQFEHCQMESGGSLCPTGHPA